MTSKARGAAARQPLPPPPGPVMSAEGPARVPEGPVQVPRTIGVLSGTAIIVGTMIGSGIFVSPAGVLRGAGSVGLSLLVWLACGLLCSLGAVCYIELGLLIPESGAEYAYLYRGFGPLHGFLGPLPTFLFSWTLSLIVMPVSTAVLTLTAAQYGLQMAYGADCSPPPLVFTLTAALVCCLVTAANCYSIRLATGLQNVTTLSKLTAIGVIVAGGAYQLGRGNTQHLATGFQGTSSSAGAIATAFYNGLWAYDGWNNLNYLTEELVEPDRVLPLAVVTAMTLVTVCYLLTNVAYLAVLSPQELLDSPAVGVSFAEGALGPAAFLVPLGVVLSVCGALNGTVIATGRASFASARRGHLPSLLSLVHVQSLTPTPALLFNAVLSLALLAVGSIDRLIDLFSFCRWLFAALVMAALLVMRRTRPDEKRPFTAPLVAPWLVLATSCYLVAAPLVEQPKLEYFYVLAFLLVGVLVYTVFVFYSWTLPGTRRVTVWCQKALELVPTA